MSSERVVSILLLCSLFAALSCRPAVMERRYQAETGVASAIDLETGLVSMDWTNEETGAVRTLAGRVTQTTEIFINGVSAGLEDVRLGDRAAVVVYPAPEGDIRWIVTSVNIERDEPFVLDKSPSRPRGIVAPSGGG